MLGAPQLEATFSRENALRWLLAAGCFALLIFFFSPPWALYALWARVPEMGVLLEVRRAATVLYQIDHLGGQVPDPLHSAIQWRILFPMIGRGLHLPHPLLFGLAHFGCVAVLAFIVTVLRRNACSWSASGALAVTLGATSWFFTSAGWLGYFDSWLVLGLLVAAFGKSRWSLWAACIWAPWVDERFVAAAPLALICRYLYFQRAGRSIDVKREFGIAVALVVGFVAVRLGLVAGRSAETATISGYLNTFVDGSASWSRVVFGAWSGLRIAWALLVAAVVLVGRANRSHAVLLAAAVLVVAAVGLFTAQDLSRSMMLLMPVALLGAISAVNWRPQLLSAAAVLALLLPAHHVMSNRVNPIFYLYHELGAFDRPPPEAMPELLELRAVQAMEQGDFTAAAESLSLAIKLARNPAYPSRQRGILFASQQQWAAARDDFSVAVKNAPREPDGWFLRAQAALALGDVAAADADLTQALAVAPAKWQERADVTRFRARLRQQG
ncbi:MAG: hypothetical protein ABIY47_01465, partial [Opitutaceae bacterium]